MNFKNTYINTTNMTPKGVNRMAEKYCKVVEDFYSDADNAFWLDDGGVQGQWRYLFVDHSGSVDMSDTKPLQSVAEITEQDLDNYLQQKENTTNYPTFDFKINLSNMSEAEKEVAKEWLSDVAESRGKSSLATNYTNKVAIMTDYKHVQAVSSVWDLEEIGELPELFLTFSKPTIASWETPSKKSEKELQLEELVGKLQQQLKEAEQQLENLK